MLRACYPDALTRKLEATAMAILERELTAQPATDKEPKRWKMTREAYHALARANFFGEDEHFELIDGEVYQRISPIGVQHVYSVNSLKRLLEAVFLPDNDVVNAAGNNMSQTSEPEPDIFVTRGTLKSYGTVQPTPRDLLLVVEVSMTSLKIDRNLKAPMYAQASVPEYWIVNLQSRQVEVYRDPQPDGTYSSMLVVSEAETVATLSKPESAIPVADFLL